MWSWSQHLQAQNVTLLDRLENLENRSRRANLPILNIPEGSEDDHDPVIFISELLKNTMGDSVLPCPPELDRSHSAAGPKPVSVCFYQYQEKDAALRWSRQHKVKYKGFILRIYPDLSTTLAKKRSAFNNVKWALYQRWVKFRLLFPAWLRVTFDGESHLFDTPEDAQVFYDHRIAK